MHTLAMIAALAAIQSAPATPVATCREWHECQRLALEAYAHGEHEQFHDLAWRTVQTGPPRNPELMYLLARAQSLSGRAHDAYVMLGRLAAMGFATNAVADDDFRAVRQLPQWAELEPSLTTARPANASPPVAAPPAAAPSVVAPPVVAPRPNLAPAVVEVARHAEDALRIRGTALGSAGLAYDRVSSRFVVADAGLRKLMIIDERSQHVVDLVTAASAGFYEITGLEIDPPRGDLWVVSAEPAGTAGDQTPASALHKLQLLSGRPLERILVPVDLQPCRFADVAVTPDGRVLLLDAVGSRLFRFNAATRTFATVAALQMQSPTSIAPAGDRVVYVAHASGIARVDIVTGAVESLASRGDVALGGFDRIRWARDSLVGVQRLSDGRQHAARIKIADRRATAVEVIDNGLSATDHPVATVSGNDFYFLVHEPDSDAADVIIRRSRLR